MLKIKNRVLSVSNVLEPEPIILDIPCKNCFNEEFINKFKLYYNLNIPNEDLNKLLIECWEHEHDFKHTEYIDGKRLMFKMTTLYEFD